MKSNFPNCLDFIENYGCDSIMTDDFLQYTTFNYLSFKLDILTDCYDFIDIKLYYNDILISHVYDEGVEKILLLKDKIKIFFKNSNGYSDNKSIDIIVIDIFSIIFISMSNYG